MSRMRNTWGSVRRSFGKFEWSKTRVNFHNLISSELKHIPAEVKRITFLGDIGDISGCPATVPDIKLRVYGGNDNAPLIGKTVTIELADYADTDYLSGKLTKRTNANGEVIFSGLKISCTGKYKFIAKSGERQAESGTFMVNGESAQPNSEISNIGVKLPRGWNAFTLVREIKSVEGAYDLYEAANGKEHAVIKIINDPDKKYDVDRVCNLGQNLSGYPNLLSIKGIARSGKKVFIRMEYALPWGATNPKEHDIPAIKQIGIETIRALADIHKNNIYHLNIQPYSIFVNEAGHFKLDLSEACGETAKDESEKQNKTQVDMAALGKTLACLYCGKSEFSGEVLSEIDCPDLSEIIKKACVFESSKGYNNISEMQQDLKYLMLKSGTHLKRNALIVVAVMALAFGGYKYFDSQYSWTAWTEKKREVDGVNIVNVESRVIQRWWAAQCPTCKTNNPYWGDDRICHNCGTTLNKGYYLDVFYYSDDATGMDFIYSRDKGKVFEGNPYWWENKKVVQYRYRIRNQ